MRKVSIFLLVGLMLIGGLAVGASAQNSAVGDNSDDGVSKASASVSANTDITINTVAAIYLDHSSVTLQPLTSDNVNMDTESPGNNPTLDTLSSQGSGYNVYAYANAGYDVTVGVDGDAPGGLNGNLQIQDSDGWENVIDTGSAASTTVISGSAGAYNSQALDYQYVPSLDDTPDSYTVSLTYTVSTS